MPSLCKALAEECPAIVHSVRVETLLLGTTPVDVRHIRAMSDQEWFEGLGGGGSHRAAQWRAVNGEEAEIEGGDYAVRLSSHDFIPRSR